jgi:hypothetical protein
VSETTLGRALEFVGQPHDVEVHRGGRWVLGSMVGWRQEEGSSCRVMVRVTEGGLERTAWAALQDVRLAEHRTYPPTESLPFIPRLPQGTTDEMTRSATSGGCGDLLGLSDFPEPVSSWAPRADAAASRTVRAMGTADEVEPDTGRHQAPAGVRHEGSDRDLRPSSPTSPPGPARSVARPRREHEVGTPAPWWPSSREPSSLLDGVEPTRLLTLPAPHHWKTAAPGPGVFPTR